MPHLRRALDLCHEFGFIDEIYRIGTFHYRHTRHDPEVPLSFHSYGICVDLSPRESVRCFEKAGFGWGGDWPSFRGPMHFELVR